MITLSGTESSARRWKRGLRPSWHQENCKKWSTLFVMVRRHIIVRLMFHFPSLYSPTIPENGPEDPMQQSWGADVAWCRRRKCWWYETINFDYWILNLSPVCCNRAVFVMGRIKEGEPCPCVLDQPNCPYQDPANKDAKLTQRGRLQATTVGPKLLQTKPSPQVALVSPLFRTLQTATIGLSVVPSLKIPVICEEAIRERIGLHICDKRSDKAEVMNQFQNVDFTNIAPGPDTIFAQFCESREQVAERGKKFFLTLKDRPETSILIVSHSSFLFHTILYTFVTPSPTGALFTSPFFSSSRRHNFLEASAGFSLHFIVCSHLLHMFVY